MQLSWRRLAPRETDHELVWLAVSTGTLGTAAVWFAQHLPWPQCAFRALTGFPCVTCGATRSAIQFFHGNFATAWTLNPLAFVAYCSVAAFDLYAFAVLTTRTPRLRMTDFSTAEKKLLRGLTVLLLAANWIYLLWARPS